MLWGIGSAMVIADEGVFTTYFYLVSSFIYLLFGIFISGAGADVASKCD